MPKSQSTNMVRKEFQLDIEDDSNKENYQMPQLIQHSDLNYLQQPVNLPKVKYVLQLFYLINNGWFHIL